ncbi:hypothetical protein [Streptomyces paromomycinus]|uniref:Uncharacterized protein n=1 Tax=Streptomyces paromomycinus TaxID=92743 RepID=A0A401WA18_STREY|nr:hypothetical protein [Streptomyces paromomycinus]GCD46140.1 hypothetical protein GKJPGBOP_05887 [Streptomyces paromomycinus]
MNKTYERTENGIATKKGAQLTDTMKAALRKLYAGEVPFMGASTVRALERRGLITANTAPRSPKQGIRSLYMLTGAGRDTVREEAGARVGHVTDIHDARPAFGILYRRYQDTRSSFVRVQADNAEAAMAALTAHVGNTQYVVTSIRPE